MSFKLSVPIFAAAVVLLAADEPWKDKPFSGWTEEDAKQVLTQSPWAKSVDAEFDRSAAQNDRRRSGGGGMGRGGGIGIGGVGIGLPGGIGGGRRGGGNPGGGGYPGGGQGGPNRGPSAEGRQTPTLQVRWESALPVREAELKARETNAPTVGESHYAIAVYGVPKRFASPDEKGLAGRLKKQAALKREGKKDLKPSSVEVLQREDGPVIVYLFPRSNEITRQDKRVGFDARVGALRFNVPFYVDDMLCAGKLEL
jgi:hypothetical protein